MADEEKTVTIDGKIYRRSDIGEKGEAQLTNLQGCEMELAELQRRSALTQTARAAYARALQDILNPLTPIGTAPSAESNPSQTIGFKDS